MRRPPFYWFSSKRRLLSGSILAGMNDAGIRRTKQDTPGETDVKSIGSRDVIARIGFAAAFALGALLTAGAANAGIANTKHNLSTSGTGAVHVSTGTEEICVFCHTPHGSDTSAPVPLWNKQLPTTSYTT